MAATPSCAARIEAAAAGSVIGEAATPTQHAAGEHRGLQQQTGAKRRAASALEVEDDEARERHDAQEHRDGDQLGDEAQ